MASKTSFFSRPVFTSLVKRYGVTGILMTLCYATAWPLRALLELQGADGDAALTASALYDTASQLPILVSALFALVVAVYLWSYLYHAPSANMMHAFPVTRRALYVTTGVAALVFLILPLVCAYLLELVTVVAFGADAAGLWGSWLIVGVLSSIFFFALATVGCQLSGHPLAAVAFYGIFQVGWDAVSFLVQTFVATFCYGMSDLGDLSFSQSTPLGFLSPVVYLTANVTITEGWRLTGTQALVGYTLCACVLFWLGWKLYQHRQLERAGDMAAFGAVKPPVRWLVSFLGGTLLAFVIYAMRNTASTSEDLTFFLVLYAVCSFVCFWLCEMVIDKSTRVFGRARLIEAAAACACGVLALGLVGNDAFGVTSRVPASKDVEIAYANVTYPILAVAEEGDGEQTIERICALHQTLVDDRNVILAQLDSGDPDVSTVPVTIRYLLKDGTVINRAYQLPYSSVILQDPTSAAAQANVLDGDVDNFSASLFGGTGWDGIQWERAQVDNYSVMYAAGDGEVSTDDGPAVTVGQGALDADQATELMAALAQDMQTPAWQRTNLLLGADENDDQQLEGHVAVSGRYEGVLPTIDRQLSQAGLTGAVNSYYMSYYVTTDTVRKNDGSFVTSVSFDFDLDSSCVHTISKLREYGLVQTGVESAS